MKADPPREHANVPPASPINQTELSLLLVRGGGPEETNGGAVNDLTSQKTVLARLLFPARSSCLTAKELSPSGRSARATGDWQAIQAPSLVEHSKVAPASPGAKVIEADEAATIPLGSP